jgi:superfamily II DNA or RNA helicase
MTTNDYHISQKGYKILLTNEKVNDIKKELMVSPYCENPVKFPVFRISDKFLYMPKYYGINKFGLPPDDNIKEQSGKSVEFKFVSNLRDYQLDASHKILTHLKKHNSGLASIYTGWGKTCMALWIASQLQRKTLIIVHTENLLQQWKERIQDFLGILPEDIGIIQGPKLDVSKNICIGMIQSISMKEYPLETFKDFGFTVMDECFPPDTYIHTDMGKKTISTLYKMWKKYSENSNEVPIKILSFNRETNKFEYKQLTYAWQKENSELIELKLSKYKIKCTLNHKILTQNGYIEADKLSINDIVLAKYDCNNNRDNIISPALNDDQVQLVYGSCLVNNSLQKTKNNRFRLKFMHCEKQRKYLEWKARIFNVDNIKYIKKKYTCFTKYFDFINTYDIEHILNNIDERGLAIWFIDDGRIYKSNLKIISGAIHSNSYDYDTHKKFILLFKKFNIDVEISKYYNIYYYLEFNEENILKLIDLIKKYVPIDDLYYKIGIEEITEEIENKYIWNNEFLSYGTLIVTGKEYIINSSKYVYDIEVEDNHNFILARNTDNSQTTYCDGPIVSNCHHLGCRVFSKIFYKIGTKYNIGLSATLTRSDGLTKVIKYFLGETIVNLKLSILNPNIIVKFTNIEPLTEKLMVNGRANIPGMINDLCASFARNLEIVSIIKEKYVEGRKILVLSDRRNQCTELKRLLGTDYSSGIYVGGMKNEALQNSNKERVIFATYQIASEGYDNKELDTLVFATPKSNIEQAVGRILRQENANEPEVIDIVDSWSVFNNLYFARSRFYKKKKYLIGGDIKPRIEDQNIKLTPCAFIDVE